MEPRLRSTCACGWEVTGTADEVVAATIDHGAQGPQHGGDRATRCSPGPRRSTTAPRRRAAPRDRRPGPRRRAGAGLRGRPPDRGGRRGRAPVPAGDRRRRRLDRRHRRQRGGRRGRGHPPGPQPGQGRRAASGVRARARGRRGGGPDARCRRPARSGRDPALHRGLHGAGRLGTTTRAAHRQPRLLADAAGPPPVATRSGRRRSRGRSASASRTTSRATGCSDGA